MTSPKSEGSQHAPALLLAGITTALIVIGVIAIFCWRLVCISAYKEASGARGSNLRLRRGQTSCIQDNNADNHHQERGHRQHPGSLGNGQHLGVTSFSLQYTLPVVLPDEYLAGPHPPAYTKDVPAPASKYIAPPSYEDSVKSKECDPPPVYTLNITDDRIDTCSSHVHVDMHQDEGWPRGQAN
ncbi:hypothetical protein KP79_PYT11810 [Mizuhopecten yessoensis]|uniref:Uncharacterized protein n=1 Tax=Mizuhopecten yessoensis TaxID=6573 RepID=A0A210QKV7_MIZYE|nr:hypothetical protein KP79_PYT11810 [Mizuhopecten yessoensis]